MRVVKFNCGCVGLRDSTNDDTIMLRDCERGDVLVFYAAQDAQHKTRPFVPVSNEDEKGWIFRVQRLMRAGHGLHTLCKIIEGGAE